MSLAVSKGIFINPKTFLRSIWKRNIFRRVKEDGENEINVSSFQVLVSGYNLYGREKREEKGVKFWAGSSTPASDQWGRLLLATALAIYQR